MADEPRHTRLSRVQWPLLTDRTELSPLVPTDATGVQSYRGLTEVTAYLPHPPLTLDETGERVATWGAALLVLGIASVMSLIDRLLSMRRRHAQLGALGAVPSRMGALSGLMFLAPYTVVTATSMLLGLIICWMLVRPLLPVPWATAVVVLAWVLAGGVIGTVVTVLAGLRIGAPVRD